MSVLLGIGDESLSKSLKEVLEAQGYVGVEETYHVDYLADKVIYEQPELIILHEHLQSNTSTLQEKEDEILKLIEHWRMAYTDSIRIVFICIRERNDPFLGRLIAHNVLDIFPDKRVPVSNLLAQLAQPPNFANVKRLATTNLKVELMHSGEEEVESVAAEVKSEGPEQDVPESVSITETAPVEKLANDVPKTVKESVAKEKTPKKEKVDKEYGKKIGETAAKATSFAKSMTEKIPKIERSQGNEGESERTELLFDELLDLVQPDAPKMKLIPSAVIGTVLIGVAGVKNHLGATHISLSAASYLSNAGHSVVVVECNNSKDFDRIHTLYEGSKQLLEQDSYFEIEGVHHYKYRNQLDLNKLYAMYEYVILDYGDLQTAMSYTKEFQRAHIRLVACSGDEWKVQWVEQFLKLNEIEKEDCTFVIPNASKSKAKDFQSQIRYDNVHAFPSQDDPYKIVKDTEYLMEDLLGEYLNQKSALRMTRYMSVSTVVVACILCIIITAVLFAVFTYL